MYNKSIFKGIMAAAALVGLIGAMPAGAATQTFDFDDDFQNFTGGNVNGNSLVLSNNGVSLTVTGWADTGGTNDNLIRDARLYWANNNALGVINRDESNDSPNHAVDNVSSNDFDMLLLEFSEAVNLEAIDFNWVGNDSDVSILAWNGGSGNLNGETWSSILATNGGEWDHEDNYSNVGTAYYSVNAGNIESSKWLIGAYNPVYGNGWTSGNDAFKLDLVSTSTRDKPPGEVPVPGTLALILLGAAGLRARKRK